ncbi:MAG TPA: ADP-ribosylglycohydrolase family protein [Pirellulales bacterium]|nr:ADP-ribosylglycohydrolase family protein [Pirellulales bacterium]
MFSLDGLSIGDAFGEQFFYVPNVESMIERRALAKGPWRYTDDTEMALAIVEVLDRFGDINQDELAAVFARRYAADPSRGYGATAHDVLATIGSGTHWRKAAGWAFGGEGSMGNGGAMRVGPLGAYWADDWDAVVEQARASAEVTHAHAEGQAGAIAVAVAAAWATRRGAGAVAGTVSDLFEAVLKNTPKGATLRGLKYAAKLPLSTAVHDAVTILGNGSNVTAPDTVPFAIWCAARHIDDYEEALWATVSGLGDCDTTCAIVGSIVALACGPAGIPPEWRASREPLAFGSAGTC